MENKDKKPLGKANDLFKGISEWIEKGVRDNSPVPIPSMDEAKIQARYLASILAANGPKIGQIAASALTILLDIRKLDISKPKMDQDLIRALDAIAQGYPIETINDRYIIVENPDFKEEVGSDDKLIIDVWALKKAKI